MPQEEILWYIYLGIPGLLIATIAILVGMKIRT
jgi:hypothetical protein